MKTMTKLSQTLRPSQIVLLACATSVLTIFMVANTKLLMPHHSPLAIKQLPHHPKELKIMRWLVSQPKKGQNLKQITSVLHIPTLEQRTQTKTVNCHVLMRPIYTAFIRMQLQMAHPLFIHIRHCTTTTSSQKTEN